jgi:ornithine cyclodeaminase/alanine dehydrogenase-like protein (mu-crystallin family)
MRLQLIPAEQIPALLPMREAAEAMKGAFAALSAGEVVAPHRMHLPAKGSEDGSLLMGALLPEEAFATKIVSIFHSNSQRGIPVVTGLVTILDPETGVPTGLCDGGPLTAWRTGAASGAATDLLAVPDARTGAVFGSGAQARTQLLAIDAVRELEEIRVYGPESEAVTAMVAELQERARAELVVASDPAAAVDGADVICTATSSSVPVFDGSLLEPGAHVNAIGTYTLDRRELDLETVGRARIFVDRVEAALEEAGELVHGAESGLTDPSAWTEIGDVAAGRAAGRNDPADVTVFKTVGHAVQDAVMAGLLLDAARQRGLATEIEL